MDRRGDFILRYYSAELGCGEDKPVDSGTNVLRERWLKCPKMMRDMLWRLSKDVDFKPENMKDLAVLGITTFGLELGCGEDKPADSGTNVLRERWLECPKMMKDMLWRLSKDVHFKPEYMKDLAVLGITTFGLDLYLDWMTTRKGYVSVITRSKKMSISNTIGSFPQSLPLLASLLTSLKIITSVIDTIEIGKNSGADFLKPSLKRAYEDIDDDDGEEDSFSKIVCSITPKNNGRFSPENDRFHQL